MSLLPARGGSFLRTSEVQDRTIQQEAVMLAYAAIDLHSTNKWSPHGIGKEQLYAFDKGNVTMPQGPIQGIKTGKPKAHSTKRGKARCMCQ